MKKQWDDHGYDQAVDILDLRDVNLAGGFTGGAVEALPAAFLWIKTGMPPTLLAMGEQLIKNEFTHLIP